MTVNIHHQETTADRAFTRYREHRAPEDLAEVFDRCAPRLILVAMHLVHDSATAEDLVQLTFVEAIRCVGRFDGDRVLLWLIMILSRRAKNELRRRQRQRTEFVDANEYESSARSSDQLFEQSEVFDRVASAIDSIDKPYREVLTLRFVHDLSPTEIARALDRPVGTVHAQLHRGGERLRRVLPRSLGGAVALVLSTERGLAAVRSAVLTQASKSTILGITFGGLALKKTWMGLIAAALLVVTGGWLYQNQTKESATERSLAEATRIDLPEPLGANLKDSATRLEITSAQPTPLVAAGSFQIRGRCIDSVTRSLVSEAPIKISLFRDQWREFSAVSGSDGQFSSQTKAAEQPLVLILQREHIDESQAGVFTHEKLERVTEWQVSWLAGSKRGPNTIADFLHQKSLIGIWETSEEPLVQVDFSADGTWKSSFSLELDDIEHTFQDTGTWEVKDGTILNTTVSHEPIPGMEEIQLPYLSREKIVAVEPDEYRYVCPIEGCINTMRRVKE